MYCDKLVTVQSAFNFKFQMNNLRSKESLKYMYEEDIS
jgi:hypothetical protein